MRLPLLPLLALLLALGVPAEEDEEEYNANAGDEESGFVGDSSKGEDEEEAAAQAVFVMEHGFLDKEPKWTPRGTLLLSGGPGRGFEARLSDAKEFVEQRPELQPLMSQAATANRYYAIRMYSPEKPKRILQASIPAKLLADHFEDWHDILEVTVGSTGAPVSLSYRVRNTLGLALFDHTQVHISEPSRSEGPHVHQIARAMSGGGGEGGGTGEKGADAPPQSFLRKYWWVGILVMLLVSNLSGAEEGGGGKAAGGGGGKRPAGK